jgi:hypothetical protein
MCIFRNIKLIFIACVAVCGLWGCAGDSRVFVDTYRLIFASGSDDFTKTAKLNPEVRYMRVTLDGRAFFIAHWFTENAVSPDKAVDVWRTGQADVIKISAGRIISVTGVQADWFAVRFENLPTWKELVQRDQAPNFAVRERDIRKNYQFGLRENMTIKQIQKPAHHVLLGVEKKDLIWYEESYQPNRLPASVFAISRANDAKLPAQVVYSWQCLAVDFCLGMQAWTPEDQTAVQLVKSRP